MKKIFLFMALAMAALTFSACCDDDTQAVAPPTPKPVFNAEDLFPIMVQACAGTTPLANAEDIVKEVNKLTGMTATLVTDKNAVEQIGKSIPVVVNPEYKVYGWGEKRKVYDSENKIVVEVPENALVFASKDEEGTNITHMQYVATLMGNDMSIVEKAIPKVHSIMEETGFTKNPEARVGLGHRYNGSIIYNLNFTHDNIFSNLEIVRSDKDCEVLMLDCWEKAYTQDNTRIGEILASAMVYDDKVVEKITQNVFRFSNTKKFI